MPTLLPPSGSDQAQQRAFGAVHHPGAESIHRLKRSGAEIASTADQAVMRFKHGICPIGVPYGTGATFDVGCEDLHGLAQGGAEYGGRRVQLEGVAWTLAAKTPLSKRP